MYSGRHWYSGRHSGPVARGRERGSGPVTVILIMGFLALLGGVALMGIEGSAAGQASKAQDAADAAALAGAGYISDHQTDQVLQAPFDPSTLAGDTGDAGCSWWGQSSAADLATENDATLSDYCWSADRADVTVTVKLNQSINGQQAQAQAVAAPGFSLSDCTIDPDFVPPKPTPATPPTDGAGNGGGGNGGGKNKPAPAPAPITTTMRCDSSDLEVTYDPTTQLFTFTDPDAVRALLDGLKPRLVA